MFIEKASNSFENVAHSREKLSFERVTPQSAHSVVVPGKGKNLAVAAARTSSTEQKKLWRNRVLAHLA